MEQKIPIPTLHLFPVLHRLLIELLTSLTPEDWQKPTVAKLWTVKDIAAHLLDVNVRNIATLHGYEPPVIAQINSYSDLVCYLNQLNATWVNAMHRVSPQLLTDLMVSTGEQHIAYLYTLDPFAQSQYSVAWAGEETSLNWFHIAREYTEKWHHQQQIRDAVGKTGLITKELFYPCIATFMYALPYTYRNTFAKNGTVIKITVSTEAGGDWYLQSEGNSWQLTTAAPNAPVITSVVLPPDTAWKLFTKAIPGNIAMRDSSISGDEKLALGVFGTIAVMA